MPQKLLLKGIPASTGQIEGTAQVFMPGDNATHFAQGNILVTTLTDPTMTQAMMKASAIVTDKGGITSHPAVLSREMGLPCVVNTKNGTALIKNGSTIFVNGDTGEVYALD